MCCKTRKLSFSSWYCHFKKAEQAQEFADKLNELEAEGYTYEGKIEDVHKLSDAELIYIQQDILDKAKENDNYSAYKSEIKWQKEVRTKAMKRLIEINDENNMLCFYLDKLE